MVDRVLVVAVEPELRAGLADELAGLDVIEAEGAADALAILRGGPEFAAVVSVLLLGARDGFEVLEEAHRCEPDARRVLVVSSVVGSLQDQIVAVSVVDHVVPRPWEPGDIRRAVRDEPRRQEVAPGDATSLRSG